MARSNYNVSQGPPVVYADNAVDPIGPRLSRLRVAKFFAIATLHRNYAVDSFARLFNVDNMRRTQKSRKGGVFVEYLLLLTVVGIGSIAGLAAVRGALLNELFDLANAISQLVP